MEKLVDDVGNWRAAKKLSDLRFQVLDRDLMTSSVVNKSLFVSFYNANL